MYGISPYVSTIIVGMVSIGSIEKIMFRTMITMIIALIKLQTKQAPSKPPFDHYQPQRDGRISPLCALEVSCR
jgi:hypothetical protein